MRDFKGMKRQRGRNRGGGNQGKPQQHNANRAFESNGPDNVKIRGNAQHVFERYQQLARDASSSGGAFLPTVFGSTGSNPAGLLLRQRASAASERPSSKRFWIAIKAR